MQHITSTALSNVKINDSFWGHIQTLVKEVVLPYQEDILRDKIPDAAKSHAIENFRIAAGEAEGEFYGAVFQDSDVAKWLETAAYALATGENKALEERADAIIDIIERAMQPDGYLNTYFTIKKPEHRWQNLLECHELYCAGHMMEAAVAYYEATGKDKLLKLMCRFADHIDNRFGKDKVRGIPGHQEVELGLLRLSLATGEERYQRLAEYFLFERGTEPGYFEEEAKKRDWNIWGLKPDEGEYMQNHAPILEQRDAVGHSVRAMYMYTAMAHLASLSGNKELYAACERLWDSTVNRRMYVTGGIGSTTHGEAFSIDYDLPNDTIYAETCASIGLAFFARRMLEIKPKGEYGDILEKVLYNGILSGMQLDGKRYFYVNPLEVVPGLSGKQPEYKHVLPVRPKWYGCACCPPNLTRLVASLGQFIYGENEDTVFAHLYVGSEAKLSTAGGVTVTCTSGLPFDGHVRFTVNPANNSAQFRFALRIPYWTDRYTVTVNGKPVNAVLTDGYAYINESWQPGDVIDVIFDMPVRRVYANAAVREDIGLVSLIRGPIVYCLEQVDNGAELHTLVLPRNAPVDAVHESLPIGKLTILKANGYKLTSSNALYSFTPPEKTPFPLTFIPYYAWANREEGGMRVFIHEEA